MGRYQGALLTLIEREGFNVFFTGDKNMEKQQRLEGRPFAVLVMSAINWPVVRPHVERISMAIEDARRGTIQTVDCGVFMAGSNATASKRTVFLCTAPSWRGQYDGALRHEIHFASDDATEFLFHSGSLRVAQIPTHAVRRSPRSGRSLG